MDEVNYTVCSGPNNSIGEGAEGRLMDRRDGKIYWVAKLRDGLCWMTQNLDYDGYGTAATSFGSSDTVAKFYNPGEYISVQPTTPSVCDVIIGNSLQKCTNWKNFDKDELYTIDLDSTTAEELHYSLGNYYNWIAATNGTAVNSGNASGSICPAGWQLPLKSNIGSYDNLFTSYGTNNKLEYGTQDVRLTPLYFVYGGMIGTTSSIVSLGSSGFYWSSTAITSVSTYILALYGSSVNASYDSSRTSAFSVRCVAR